MKKIEVLFLGANGKDHAQLQLDEEFRDIQDNIRASGHPSLLQLESAWAVQPDDVLQLLNERHPQIVHFSGHGFKTGELLFSDSDGTPVGVSIQALYDALTAFKNDIQVLFLNACFSRVQADMLTKVIDCVIAMNQAISDDAARIFAAAFYRAIGFGVSVQNAFEQGKAALSLRDLHEKDTIELLVKPGVNPAKKYLLLPSETDPLKVFISYDRKDKKILEELAKHLKILQRQKLIEIWHDRDVAGGGEWKAEQLINLHEAQIVLLLISKNFISSDNCYDKEMAIAMERRGRKEVEVLPIILSPCDWQETPFSGLKALPWNDKPITTWRNQDEAFLEVTQGIRSVAEVLRKRARGEAS